MIFKSIVNSIAGLFSRRELSATYDSAQTVDDNARHWANADSLSADASGSPSVRKTIRERARYEAQQNNSYAKGIVLTLSSDTIGTRPRLQVLHHDKGIAREIERKFSAYVKEINLGEKLRTMVSSRVIDGESFAIIASNPRLSGVRIDLRLIEAEQVTTPFMSGTEPDETDGIVFDDFGPVAYRVLGEHPGESRSLHSLESKLVRASDMIHLFRCDRPGQHRGISELVTALPLFSQLRRFTLATLASAETVADIVAVMYTDGAAVEDPASVESLIPIDLEKRTMLSLPRGWKMGQIKAEHPQTTYPMFKGEILNEIARALSMPFNIAAGNSSSYNYASGRLDHQTYHRMLSVSRSHIESAVLNRLFVAWLEEAMNINGFLPSLGMAPDEVQASWMWDGFAHVDPLKEANAAVTLVDAGLMTKADYYAERGKDWEEAAEQIKRETEVFGSTEKQKPDKQNGQTQETQDA